MKIQRSSLIHPAFLIFVMMLPVISMAQENPGQIASWNNFSNQLELLDDQMLAALPERIRDNPQIQQEASRLLLAALVSNAIGALASDPAHPVFVPWINSTLNVFQPNADTVYKAATISPEGVYRLRGHRGSVRIFKLWQFAGSPEEMGKHNSFKPNHFHDFMALPVNDSSQFDVVLSPTRPDGYQGEWWQLDPTTTRLWIRQVSYDWGNEQDPTISIERLDTPVTKTRPTAVDIEAQFNGLAERVANTATYLVDHPDSLRQAGYINRFRQTDYSQAGFAEQFYYEGIYDLAPEEALIITAHVPAECHYWSLILTNEIYETTDWYNNHSSLNGSQVRQDEDQLVRVVVSQKDPGIANWLDTAGYTSGVIQGRWTDCSENPLPTVEKVVFTDVKKKLPDSTPSINPEQREALIRERRSHLQQRPLW